MEKILQELINCEISSYTTPYAPDRAVVTISNLCKLTGYTRYKARKALKGLIAEGLVEYTSQGCPAIESRGEYRELVVEAGPPINGYALIEKGFQSNEYKQAYEDWCKSMEEWANGQEDDIKRNE